MAERQETIADIIAWLRRPREGENAYLTVWRDEIADRLEAAWKREREVTKSPENVNSGAASDTAGNCAKLREALQSCLDTICRIVWIDDPEYDEDGHYLGANYAAVSRDKARAALAAPARNCDKYATADEALKAQEQMFNDSNFANGECKLGCPECDNPRVGCKIAWLFAPATEKEGGSDER